MLIKCENGKLIPFHAIDRVELGGEEQWTIWSKGHAYYPTKTGMRLLWTLVHTEKTDD